MNRVLILFILTLAVITATDAGYMGSDAMKATSAPVQTISIAR